ncbi:MAG: tRNA pseudouridine(38-40) synthase TruA [Eubacterium sp.]|nr:tRNA pseudouridine(38-40) synthase TruA [Eubacterium sp.]
MRKNYRLTISYDGTRYQGWQKQKKTSETIQGKLEEILKRMMPLYGSRGGEEVEIQVIGAGRTDAGVHARAMTANVFLDITIDEEGLRDYLNRYLPDDISVDAVKVASDRFHSRFQALAKTYCYSLYCGDAKPVFDRKYVTILEHRPNVEWMRRAANDLLGNHNFKAFCGNPKMKKSTWRRIDAVEIIEEGDYIRIYYRGNAFLQNMVRIMTGTLLEIGFGRMPADAIPGILASLDRTQAGPTAPAKGLCMMEVHYD